MPKRSRSYKMGLYEQLRNDSEALAYLQAAIDDSIPAFLKALRNVADARSVSKVADQSGLDRVNLYRMLTENGNPRLNSLTAVLSVLGVRLSVEPVETQKTVESVISAETKTELPVLSFTNRIFVNAVCTAPVSVDTELSVSTASFPMISSYDTEKRLIAAYA